MASGLPCVATRVSGSEEVIQHGVNGLLVDTDDHQALAEALLSLLRDPALARQFGHAARATAEARYSLEHVTDIYLELYQSLHRGQALASPPQISASLPPGPI
jgi:glycosyltransferase involved in cell wall biosynthesis